MTALLPLRLAGGACLLALLLTAGCGRSGALPELAAIDDTARMKRTFYSHLQPFVAQENARILKQREALASIRGQLAAADRPGWLARRQLKALAEEYEVAWEPGDLPGVADALWPRVDVIPGELALAQAAKESGWGRSRFAVEANNLFGQWCYEPGCGLVPARRPPGARHEVAAFDSVAESIRRYMNNLNTHERYAPLRRLRAGLRTRDQAVTGSALAPGLLAYSQRGEPYVEEILAMMRHNAELLEKTVAL